MTQEKLERALAIQKVLRELTTRKENWRRATGFRGGFYLHDENGLIVNLNESVSVSSLPFDTLKAAALAVLEREIAPLQAEFDEL